MQSMFGETISDIPPPRRIVDRAHAARPGTGPEKKMCGDCKHIRRVGHNQNRKYHKCGLMRNCWSCGPATDIRCKDLACKLFAEGANP